MRIELSDLTHVEVILPRQLSDGKFSDLKILLTKCHDADQDYGEIVIGLDKRGHKVTSEPGRFDNEPPVEQTVLSEQEIRYGT